ncbi:hypothetical protein ACJX0J_016776, partial [Zea mays]
VRLAINFIITHFNFFIYIYIFEASKYFCEQLQFAIDYSKLAPIGTRMDVLQVLHICWKWEHRGFVKNTSDIFKFDLFYIKRGDNDILWKMYLDKGRLGVYSPGEAFIHYISILHKLPHLHCVPWMLVD